MMDLKKKYAWSKLNNGLYVIYDVETIRTFSDVKRGNLDMTKLQDLKRGLDKQEQAGQWIPVFFGHHESYENHQLSGFLDDFRIIQDVLYCNIVNISEESFQEIKAGKWPYRSPEYNVEANRLTGLALCASQVSYFIFPMFFLEDEEKKEIDLFSINRKSEKILKFCACEGAKKMEEKDGIEQPEKDKEFVPGNESVAKMKCAMEESGGKLDQILQSIDRLAASIEKLLSMESEEQEGDTEELPESDIEADGEKNSSSVAFQLRQFERKMDTRIKKLEEGNLASSYEKEILNFCDSANVPNSDLLIGQLKKFSTDKDKKAFVDFLKDTDRFSSHRLSGLANYPQATSDNVLQKYANSSPQEKKLAQKAYRAYQDTLLIPDQGAVRKFTAIWPDPERWVANCIEESKHNPNYIDEMTGF